MKGASILCALMIAFVACGSASAQRIAEGAVNAYPRGPAAIPTLHEIWAFSAHNIHPRALGARFDSRTLDNIENTLRSANDMALADVLNPFFESFGVSRVRLYDTRHQSYYMLRSLFSTGDIDAPELYTIGIQLDELDIGLIRAVMQASPAASADLRRGDRIVAVDGAPFESLLQWQRERPTTFTARGSGGDRDVTFTPVLQSVHRALARATEASSNVFQCTRRRIGYLHLWSATHNVFLESLNEAVANAQRLKLDGFVLDLRDGYGGGGWEYLDPFFSERDEYFEVVTYDASGATEPPRPELQANPNSWTGPLAIIVNGGTRGGKEVLAYQFKRTRRAMLFGETTSGAYAGDVAAFADRNDGHILLLPVSGLSVDGLTIEGVGVSPDVAVADVSGEDAPLSAALEHLACEL